MLDKNDRKYIIRRIITYIAIAMIMFFISSCQAKALEVDGANYKMSKMYITNSGVQSEYNIQEIVYNGSAMQGYQGSTLQSVSKFAFETNLAFKEKMNHYEYVSFFIYTNGAVPIADIGGVMCEQNNSSQTYSDPYTTTEINSGYTGYTCRINYTTQTYINFYVNGTNSNNNLSTILLSKYFTFFNTGEGETASAVNEVNNTLNDSTPPSSSEISGSSSEWNSYNSDNGVINNLVLMPVTLLNSFVNGMNNTCSSYDLGELWGEHIILPCINLSQMLGTVWSIIDIILSGVFIFVFGKQCVKIFNDFTNLRSGQIDTLYGGGN